MHTVMEMDGGKHKPRGYTMSSNKRLPYLLLVLLAIGAATLSVSVLHKMRERRVFSILLQEREQQLMSLQALLEKELEAALVEKENHINQMKEIVATSGPDQMVAIKELLQKKEAELEEIKTKFQDSKKPDTEVSSNAALGTNSENAVSDTVALDNSASSGDTMPAPEINHNEETNVASTNNEDVNLDTVILEEKPNSSDSIPAPAELHSTNTTAFESIHQDERILEGTNNEDITPDTVVLDEKASPSGSIPAQEEELQSYNTTASESNRQEDSSSEQFIKFTTNFEGDALQEKIGDANQEDSDPPPNDVLQEKRGDANQENSDPPPNDVIQEKRGDANQEDSDPPPKETHLEESEHHLADNQEVGKGELDGARKLEDSQGEISNHSSKSELLEKEDSKEVDRESGKEVNPDGARKLEDPQGEISNHSSKSELLEKEDSKEVDRESGKEVNPDGEVKISKDSEANQEIMQVVEPVTVPADINPSMPTNNDETKETSRRHRKRKSRSKRRKRSEVAASNVSGEVVKER